MEINTNKNINRETNLDIKTNATTTTNTDVNVNLNVNRIIRKIQVPLLKRPFPLINQQAYDSIEELTKFKLEYTDYINYLAIEIDNQLNSIDSLSSLFFFQIIKTWGLEKERVDKLVIYCIKKNKINDISIVLEKQYPKLDPYKMKDYITLQSHIQKLLDNPMRILYLLYRSTKMRVLIDKKIRELS